VRLDAAAAELDAPLPALRLLLDAGADPAATTLMGVMNRPVSPGGLGASESLSPGIILFL
jgi:hypothetical protein